MHAQTSSAGFGRREATRTVVHSTSNGGPPSVDQHVRHRRRQLIHLARSTGQSAFVEAIQELPQAVGEWVNRSLLRDEHDTR